MGKFHVNALDTLLTMVCRATDVMLKKSDDEVPFPKLLDFASRKFDNESASIPIRLVCS